MADLYKVYVTSRKKDGTVTKSDKFLVREESKEDAIERAIKYAKDFGFKGKVHVGSIFKRDQNKIYQPI